MQALRGTWMQRGGAKKKWQCIKKDACYLIALSVILD
jgi:hypothetical protein